MARIRSLKIGFFENEELARQPYEARLLFEGLWLLADREGRLEDRPLRVKARIFPYDTIDADALLQLLHDAGFILRYAIDGVAYIQVVNFGKHQRPKADEAASAIPAPCLKIPPLIGAVPRLVGDGPALGKGHRTEDREIEGKGLIRDDADTPPPDVLAVLWNELTSAPLPRCKEVSAKRRKHMHVRLTERPVSEWRAVVARIEQSTFCRGFNERGWVASFDWMIGSPEVAVKVLEGKYDDRRKMSRVESSYQPTQHADYDTWPEVCRQRHGGDCGNYQAHCFRLERERLAS